MGTLTEILSAEGKAICAELEGKGANSDSRRMATLIKAADRIVSQSDEKDRAEKELLFGLTLSMANHLLMEDRRERAMHSRITEVEEQIRKTRNGLTGAENVLRNMKDSAAKTIGLSVLSVVAPLYPMRYVLMIAILSPFTAGLLTQLIPLITK